ncbi:nucleotidyl transferase AbiEii/AbiGii toxin family protein [Candidatus Methylomirabilis sp.]|uniref:nucleotidyl transferase AbiEii/AbiGii toxin family protein n=1 Tax=Candidatus Methylomirabilis sp. TaxID=2032687 RepID=UPI0030767BCD
MDPVFPVDATLSHDTIHGRQADRKEIEARSMIGEIEDILDALNQARVRYLVVGGVAVVLHGYLRTTADLDLSIQLDRDNVLRAIRALHDHHYRPRAPVSAEEFAEKTIREQWIREKGLAVFTLWSPAHPTLEIDLFVNEPFDFNAVYARALRIPLEKTEATVIALEDLIAMKKSVARPRDIEDIAALESLADKGKESEEDSDE